MKRTLLPKRSPQLHQVSLPEKLHKTCVMTDCKNKPFCSIYKQQFAWFASDLQSGMVLYFLPASNNVVFSARWSCGAEQRSASRKQQKRSLSQEQSAITSCVMWPIGRKFTSKPRWLEKRYTSFIFTDISTFYTVKHPIKYLCVIPLCLLCMCIGSELLSLPSGV